MLTREQMEIYQTPGVLCCEFCYTPVGECTCFAVEMRKRGEELVRQQKRIMYEREALHRKC